MAAHFISITLILSNYLSSFKNNIKTTCIHIYFFIYKVLKYPLPYSKNILFKDSKTILPNNNPTECMTLRIGCNVRQRITQIRSIAYRVSQWDKVSSGSLV